jgi:hypothetical protein
MDSVSTLSGLAPQTQKLFYFFLLLIFLICSFERSVNDRVRRFHVRRLVLARGLLGGEDAESLLEGHTLARELVIGREAGCAESERKRV